MHDVLARIGELLGGQRPGVPAREARRLGDAQAEDLAEQRVIGALRGEPREAGRDLRVEHVRNLALQPPAHQRDVLPPRVHDDLNGGVGEHVGEWAEVEILLERVDQRDPLSRAGALGDGELHEAQQGPVAALAHELGVERELPRFARTLRERPQSLGLSLEAHGAAPGSR